jgi:alkylation response protein AidB-like acyl-CoA dehydrogenase
MARDGEFLAIAREYFAQEVEPRAEELDRSPEALRTALQGMADRSLLGAKIPEKWGGSALEERTFSEFQILNARYSGALTFLQTQHQSAGGLLSASGNESLQQAYLPQMTRGEKLVGVGFSQLRRTGEPMVKAVPVMGGYEISGEVPWITGWGFFGDFILGATLPDGRSLYGLVPLAGGEDIELGEPMPLIAMGATNTIHAYLRRYFLPGDRVVAIHPAAAIHESDRKNVLHHGFFALGCAFGSLEVLKKVSERKELESMEIAREQLEESVTLCGRKMLDAGEAAFEERLYLRGRAIDLAGLCSRAAVIASGGAANFLDHPAGRLYREALVFSVSGQTIAVMEASLQQLLAGDRRCYD